MKNLDTFNPGPEFEDRNWEDDFGDSPDPNAPDALQKQFDPKDGLKQHWMEEYFLENNDFIWPGRASKTRIRNLETEEEASPLTIFGRRRGRRRRRRGMTDETEFDNATTPMDVVRESEEKGAIPYDHEDIYDEYQGRTSKESFAPATPFTVKSMWVNKPIMLSLPTNGGLHRSHMVNRGEIQSEMIDENIKRIGFPSVEHRKGSVEIKKGKILVQLGKNRREEVTEDEISARIFIEIKERPQGWTYQEQSPLFYKDLVLQHIDDPEMTEDPCYFTKI